jgi:hypothetical protein
MASWSASSSGQRHASNGKLMLLYVLSFQFIFLFECTETWSYAI